MKCFEKVQKGEVEVLMEVRKMRVAVATQETKRWEPEDGRQKIFRLIRLCVQSRACYYASQS